MQRFLKLRSRYPNAKLACTALVIGLASLSTMTVRVSAQTFGAASVPSIVTDIAKQPLMVQVDHLLQALSFVGRPVPDSDRDAIYEAAKLPDSASARAALRGHTSAQGRHQDQRYRASPHRTSLSQREARGDVPTREAGSGKQAVASCLSALSPDHLTLYSAPRRAELSSNP